MESRRKNVPKHGHDDCAVHSQQHIVSRSEQHTVAPKLETFCTSCNLIKF